MKELPEIPTIIRRLFIIGGIGYSSTVWTWIVGLCGFFVIILSATVHMTCRRSQISIGSVIGETSPYLCGYVIWVICIRVVSKRFPQLHNALQCDPYTGSKVPNKAIKEGIEKRQRRVAIQFSVIQFIIVVGWVTQMLWGYFQGEECVDSAFGRFMFVSFLFCGILMYCGVYGTGAMLIQSTYDVLYNIELLGYGWKTHKSVVCGYKMEIDGDVEMGNSWSTDPLEATRTTIVGVAQASATMRQVSRSLATIIAAGVLATGIAAVFFLGPYFGGSSDDDMTEAIWGFLFVVVVRLFLISPLIINQKWAALWDEMRLALDFSAKGEMSDDASTEARLWRLRQELRGLLSRDASMKVLGVSITNMSVIRLASGMLSFLIVVGRSSLGSS